MGESSGTFPSLPQPTVWPAHWGVRHTVNAYAVIENQTQFGSIPRSSTVGATSARSSGFIRLTKCCHARFPGGFRRYRVSVTNNLSLEIAAKSKVSPLSSLAYEIPFEPPGHGLNLNITAYKSEVRWIPLLLMGSLGILATAIVWSLWQLRRHMQRRQAAEQALRSGHAYRKAMEDSLNSGMRARDLNGKITYVNPAFCRMVGWSADELIGLMRHPYWAPETLERTLAVHQMVLGGNAPPQGMEIRLMRRNGERFDALIEAPLIDSDGRHIGWMGSMVDVTEQKRAQDLARQQQERLQATARLVTMGEMASTLAHELNQPLAAISSYNTGCLNMIGRGEISPAELTGVLEKVGKQAQRAAQIIRRVHAFVEAASPNASPVDVNAIIREAVGLVEPDAQRRGVNVRWISPSRFPQVPPTR